MEVGNNCDLNVVVRNLMFILTIDVVHLLSDVLQNLYGSCSNQKIGVRVLERITSSRSGNGADEFIFFLGIFSAYP